jgi:hypothetical protein
MKEFSKKNNGTENWGNFKIEEIQISFEEIENLLFPIELQSNGEKEGRGT